jgi:hypothetical protein
MQRSQIDDRLVNDSVRISQIIVAAMVAGVIMFLGVVLFGLVKRQPEGPIQASSISYLAVAIFAGGVLLSLIVPKQMVNAQVTKLAADGLQYQSGPTKAHSAVDQDLVKLMPLFQSKTIVANAVLEGPAFFATYAYMFERQPFALAIVVAAVALMLMTFPTRSKVRDWLESQQDRIDGIRQFGGSTF